MPERRYTLLSEGSRAWPRRGCVRVPIGFPGKRDTPPRRSGSRRCCCFCCRFIFHFPVLTYICFFIHLVSDDFWEINVKQTERQRTENILHTLGLFDGTHDFVLGNTKTFIVTYLIITVLQSFFSFFLCGVGTPIFGKNVG